jgi:hypothetical protein
MSEYQYYEFQALDRPLTAEQQAMMRRLSKRVELSATRAAFNYSYGDFPAEPLEVLEQQFDALLYIANWGSKQLAFRFPSGAIPDDTLRSYLVTGRYERELVSLRVGVQHTVLSIEFHEQEGYGWIEGDGLLAPLIPLREAILRGDVRALYLAWLKAADYQQGRSERAEDDEEDGWDEDEQGDTEEAAAPSTLLEPPVPPGLGQLDAPLRALMEFLELDQDLVAAAAEASPKLSATDEPIEQWIKLLPAREREAFLVRVARGEAQVGVALLRRLRELAGTGVTLLGGAPRRTFDELKTAAAGQQKLRVQREREAAERERLAKLEALARREAQAWASIPALLAKRTAGSYDEGVALLAELRDLAVHRGQQQAFSTRLAQVLAPYAASPALQRRLREKRLVER